MILKNLVEFDSIKECPKCGGTDLNRLYHEKEECRYGCGDTDIWIEEEHHYRYCRECSYEWREKVK